jgi:ribosomal protein S14
MVKKFRSKDNRYRQNVAKSELHRMQLYYLLKCSWVSSQEKRVLMAKRFVLRLTSLNSLTRVRNGCVVTGRSSSVTRLVRLSRMQFKNQASLGFVMGFRRATW